MIMNGDEVVFSYYTLKVVTGIRILLPEILKKRYQGFLAIIYNGIMLGVCGT
jgi:hypothetical protein